MPKFTIRTVRPGDVSGIIELLQPHEPEDGIHADTLDAVWRWQYQENPCAIHDVLIATDSEDRVVGHEGIVPFRYRVGDQVCTGGLPSKLVVAESWRRAMIFPRIEMQLLRSYSDLGIQFLFSPQVNHLEAHCRLGFNVLGELAVYARPYRLDRLLKHFVPSYVRPLLYPAKVAAETWFRWPPRLARSLTVEQVDCFDERIDAFCAGQLERYQIHALRTAAILNWRFVAPRNRCYSLYLVRESEQVVGYAVLRRMRMKEFEVLALVDFLHEPQRADVAQAVQSCVHQAALAEQVDMAACLLNPHSPLLPGLRGWGYRKTPESFTLIVHNAASGSVRFGATAPCWHITWFDHDYV